MSMSANAVLMKFFKLPPAVRMMLALAGFGSLAAVLFRLLPALRSKQGQMWILAIFGIGLVVFLLIWGIRRLMFGKKASQLNDALESQGPSRGEIAEQEQIYRDKFRGKLAELKTNGLSVYKLPWFVLMGEPGCGKTASLIHSGLDFPLGKDEVPGFGGTRNYNWWFANEGVILDTAGRIAFHEEGTTDKVEWEYFCKLLKQNRPRCPINGIVIALPADKLLRDSSEERAQKATVLRERLRQIHQLLGVRFPTFVLVTKMDLVGGFSEYFEEIRVDLQQRNQMFGWSRPGEFQEPFDPGDFMGAFESVHDRLRAWSMRYLQRKATDEELGMIVTFPEAFKQLAQPLNDYVGTIFQKSPLLEPPFFRGFYFTSAMQEGAPILDVFARSTTAHISEHKSRAVDSKAFFIHDLYANKVFPEHGLVFRSAKHVNLNQRMRKLVWVGSAAMLALMLTFFGFGWMGTRALVDRPLQACTDASTTIEARDANFEGLSGNVHRAKELRGHYEAYNGAWNAIYARMLFIGANIRVPQEDVGAIHNQFVLSSIVRPVLEQAGTQLRTAPPPIGEREGYKSALRIYAEWYGEVVGNPIEPALDGAQAAQRRTEFEQLLRFVGVQGEELENALTQFELALEGLGTEQRAFARDVLSSPLVSFATGAQEPFATETLIAAVQHIENSWRAFANLENNADDDLAYWRDFGAQISNLRTRYREVLAQQEAFGDPERFAEASQRYGELTNGVNNMRAGAEELPPVTGTLYEAWDSLRKFLREREVPETPDRRIRRLVDLLNGFEQSWGDEFSPIETALAKGAPDRALQPQERVYSAIQQSRTDLRSAMSTSLNSIREQFGIGEDEEPLDYYTGLNLFKVYEAPAVFNDNVRIEFTPSPFGPDDALIDYLETLRKFVSEGKGNDLDNLTAWPGLIRGLNEGGDSDASRLSQWIVAVRTGEGTTRRGLIVSTSRLGERMFWQPYDLFGLATSMKTGWQTSTVEALLQNMEQRAKQTLEHADMPGIARLMPGYNQPSDLPFVRHRFNSNMAAMDPEPAPEPEVAEPDPTPEPEERPAGRRRAFGSRRDPQPEDAEPAQPEAQPEDAGRRRFGARETERPGRPNTRALLAKYHEIQTLHATMGALEQAVTELKRKGDEGAPVIAALNQASTAYLNAYFTKWEELGGSYSRLLPEELLSMLEKLQGGQLSWPEYVAYLRENGSTIGNTTGRRMEAFIRNGVLFDQGLDDHPQRDAIIMRIDDFAYNGTRLPYQHEAMASDLNRPNGIASSKYASRVMQGWSRYVGEVVSLGGLQDGEQSSNEQPATGNLPANMLTKQAFTQNFAFVEPLIETARYGDALLVDHLDARFAALFQRSSGYPVGGGGAADPGAFIKLLGTIRNFQRDYGELYSRVKSQDNSPTFSQCDAWARFLYGSDMSALERGDMPPARPVTVGFCEPARNSGVTNPGNAYGQIEVTVPLLSGGAPAPTKQIPARSGPRGLEYNSAAALSGNNALQLTWNLSVPRYPTCRVVLLDKNPDADSAYPNEAPAQNWTYSGGPWTVLRDVIGAASSEGNGIYRSQAKINLQKASYGLDIVFDFKMDIPRPITPFTKSGSRPTMSAASKYLSGR